MAPSRTSAGPVRNSPCAKHIGALPSQQPPDWWNRSPPWRARSRSISSRAAAVAVTRSTISDGPFLLWGGVPVPAGTPLGRRGSEEAQRLRAVADQEVLGLLVVVEHHLVVLAPDAGLLVAAEGGVRRVEVVAVRPDPPGLDLAAEAVGAAAVAGPHARPQAVERVVGDRERLRLVLEGRDRQHGPEDLLLEHPHLVVPREHGRLDVVAALELAAEPRALSAGQHRPPPPPAHRDVG